MEAKAKRLQYVDALKGIGILWIIFYHLTAEGGFKSYVLNPLMELFLVLFFFFSGYFHRPNKAPIGKSIGKRALSLLVPFAVYALIFWVIGTLYLTLTNQAPFMETLGCLRNFFIGAIWNRDIQGWFHWEYYSLGKRYLYLADFWFLLAMFFASVLFFLIIDKIVKKTPLALGVTAILFALTGVCVGLHFTLPYNLHMVPYWTAFMVLGAFAGNRKLIELPSLERGPKYAIGVTMLLASIAIALLKTPALNQFRGSFGGDNEVVSMLLCIAAALPFLGGIGILFQQFEQDGLRFNEASWLGTHSFTYYLFHMFYAWLLGIIFGFSVLKMEWWVGLLVAIASIALCTGQCLLMDFITRKVKEKKMPPASTESKIETLEEPREDAKNN